MSAPVLDRLGAELARGQRVRFNPGPTFRTTAPEPHFGVIHALREMGLVLIRPEQSWYRPRPAGAGYMRTNILSIEAVWAHRVPAWVCLRGAWDRTGEWVERA